MNNTTNARRGTIIEQDGIHYQTGFDNTFESECIPGALPQGRSNPRLVPFQLYTEQLSGTAFTAPRAENRRIWLYRIQPSVVVQAAAATDRFFGGISPSECTAQVDPLRWKPASMEHSDPYTFLTGMKLVCAAGDPVTKNGLAIYRYVCGKSMGDTSLYNSDGDFLIVPQEGELLLQTEVGRFLVQPNEIIVVPRGFVFTIDVKSAARGYVLEVYNGGFQLPELGPIGSNGMANARDFYYPTAHCVSSKEQYRRPSTIYCKIHSKLYEKQSDHSPFNVVAWHGNYLPYKYDLTKFCAINSVTYDHMDPSIYTVLTCPSDHAGTALADFVIFPPRIMATDENTLRPPWFHRNTMSEFMGLISGSYDAKAGFQPGGASLHNCMTPHGPDRESYDKAVRDECKAPAKFEGGLAFMFETSLSLQVAPLKDDELDTDYMACWQDLEDQFTGWDLLENEQAS